MTYNEILSRFKVKRSYGDKAQCICPVHDDKEASLTISKGDKGTVVFCHACGKERTPEILEAVGLKMTDLFDDDPIQNTGERWRSYVEGREKRQIEDVYNYVDLNGNYAFTRLRLSGKKFLYGIMDGDRFNYGLKGKRRATIPAVYCESLKAVRTAIENGQRVFYCEGEKDVKTVNKHGLTGITCGASGDWCPDCATLFEGADVVILQDNDKSGKESSRKIEKDLLPVAKSVRIIVPTPDLEKGDISDFFTDHTVEDLEALLNEEPKDDPGCLL
jgi:putative DNA primase/helicase